MATVLELLSNMPSQANMIPEWQTGFAKDACEELDIRLSLPLSPLYPNDSSIDLFACQHPDNAI